MRNLIVLGASALVLALGVAQASAIPTTEQWQEHLDQMHNSARTPPTCATSAPRRPTRATRSSIRRPPPSTLAAADRPATDQENVHA